MGLKKQKQKKIIKIKKTKKRVLNPLFFFVFSFFRHRRKKRIGKNDYFCYFFKKKEELKIMEFNNQIKKIFEKLYVGNLEKDIERLRIYRSILKFQLDRLGEVEDLQIIDQLELSNESLKLEIYILEQKLQEYL